MFKPCKGTKSEKGVALIMVLGLLTVMIILAVTFAVSMRTERLAAGNYADTVRARELVHVGLARAMDQLANNLGTNGLASTVGGKAYPGWNVTNSYTNIPGTTIARWAISNGIVRGEASNYVPHALWTAATNADLTNPSNHWLPVEHLVWTNDGSATPYLVESNLMGRVAYVILNCSGLLDANYAGGAAGTVVGNTRVGSTSPADIAIGNLGEVKAAFLTTRQTDIRYETVGELNALADIYKPASNLFIYSRCPAGYWNNGVVTQVNLSGSAAELALRRDKITNAFCQAGFSDYESVILFSNLLDYVDSDSIPTNLDYCVESVPMINEIVVSNNVTVAPGTLSGKKYTVNTAVYIECWYPFIINAGLAFNLNSAVTFSEAGGIKPDNLPSWDDSLGTPSAGDFIVIPRICGQKIYDNVDPDVNPIRLISSITLSLKVNADTVDQITAPVTLTNENDGAIINPACISYTSAECRDPRFNANPSDANQWRKKMGALPSHTLGGINSTWPGGLFPADSDGDEKMFVTNQPLRSVAELGYLVYSTNFPWKTVKLYGPDRHRVLDVFGLSTNASDVYVTNIVYRGRVNCNSNAALDATAVVFAGMPVDQYPGGTVLDSLDITEARAVASSIFGGMCTNLSDIGRNLTAFPVGDTELEKESYFRNSMNLINLRQNVFTIIIEAQTASGGNIPRNPARQRAIAIVWRDPYTGEMFVRHLKWLGD